jgi:hypothetical protein
MEARAMSEREKELTLVVREALDAIWSHGRTIADTQGWWEGVGDADGDLVDECGHLVSARAWFE